MLVSHTHMDHFIGFDLLLRLALGRQKPLTIYGPAGFLRHVRGKIEGYAWNLIESYPVHLVACELDGETIRSVAFRGAGKMRPEPLPDRPFQATLHAQRGYTVQAERFDHGIPVLGFALHETEHLSVNKDRLARAGLKPGPWLHELKMAVRRRRPDDTPVEADSIDGTRTLGSGELARQILFRTPGQKLVYLTDLRFTEANRRRALELARDADLLVCEAAFAHADAALAAERFHLTARQAGELAREAAVRRLAVFHLSPRYQGREQELLDEASDAFGSTVIRLPQGPTDRVL